MQVPQLLCLLGASIPAIGQFRDEVGYRLGLDGSPWNVMYVKLSELYRPLKESTCDIKLRQNLSTRLVSDYLNRVSLEVRA